MTNSSKVVCIVHPRFTGERVCGGRYVEPPEDVHRVQVLKRCQLIPGEGERAYNRVLGEMLSWADPLRSCFSVQ